MMSASVRVLIGIFAAASMLTVGSPFLAMQGEAEDTEPESVPAPWVHETHEYDVPGDVDGEPTDEYFVNEKWSVEVRHGDVMTLIMARNITQGDSTFVDYTNNIHYYVQGKLYIAQFMIMGLAFEIGGVEVQSSLTGCADFEVWHSPTVYDGTVPTLDCNITYEDIRVYDDPSLPSQFRASTIDLTLVHHIRADWDNTHVKIEALIDFAEARFFNPSDNNEEFDAGEPLTAKVSYMMMLSNPEDFRTTGPVIPTSQTNTTLEYNMTLDNGVPLTVSKLEMRDDFTVFNASGARDSVGYSSMNVLDGWAQVTHGFPNMTYMDTLSMKSDPEIVIYHELVTESYEPFDRTLLLIPAVAAIAVAGAVVFVKMRKARKSP